jgi:hypothetical protein
MQDDVRDGILEHIPLDEIFVPAGRRPVDDAWVTELSQSIDELGLFNPIGVVVEEAGCRLVHGAPARKEYAARQAQAQAFCAAAQAVISDGRTDAFNG